MHHGCLDCTQVKQYHADLINEGANLGESVGDNDSEVEGGMVCIPIQYTYYMH